MDNWKTKDQLVMRATNLCWPFQTTSCHLLKKVAECHVKKFPNLFGKAIIAKLNFPLKTKCFKEQRMTKTNTFREYLQRAIVETCDL